MCVWSTLDWISWYLESVQIGFVPDRKKGFTVIIQHLQASSHLFYVGREKIYMSLRISCCEEPGPHSNGRMASVQTAIIDERVVNAQAQWRPKGPCSIYHNVWDLKEKLSLLPRRRSSRRCPPKAWTHYSNVKNPIEMPRYKHLHMKMVRENWSWSEKPWETQNTLRRFICGKVRGQAAINQGQRKGLNSQVSRADERAADWGV